MPWNLVYHSAFKINHDNIGVIWLDSFTLNPFSTDLSSNKISY